MAAATKKLIGKMPRSYSQYTGYVLLLKAQRVGDGSRGTAFNGFL